MWVVDCPTGSYFNSVTQVCGHSPSDPSCLLQEEGIGPNSIQSIPPEVSHTVSDLSPDKMEVVYGADRNHGPNIPASDERQSGNNAEVSQDTPPNTRMPPGKIKHINRLQ